MGLDIARKYAKFKLWYDRVIKEENNYKLPLKDKLLAIKYGFSSNLYHMYGLNKGNIKDYISEYQRYLSREINGEYKILFDNKILFTKFFEEYINVPKILAIILEKIYNDNGKELKDFEIVNILRENKSIIKPISGTGGGTGVHLIECIDTENNIFLIDEEERDEEQLLDFIKKSNGCIITKFIEQNEYSKMIWNKATNTIRVITIKKPETNEYIIPLAVHRWGNRKSGPVDNACKGGYVTKINVENGIMGETKTYSNLTPIDKHPDSNAIIKGKKIPKWEEIKQKLIENAKKLPYIPFIAWDILIDENENFYAIEVNASSSLELFQMFGSIKETELWKFYEYYGVIKSKGDKNGKV